MVGRRAGDPAHDVVGRAPAEQLVEPLALEAPPVGAQREHRRRVRDDGRRPVDGVDLRHQRRVDEPGLVVEILVVELGVLRVQVLADRVVLAHEQRVEQREADPEVARDAGQVDVLLELDRRQARLVDLQLAVGVRAERVGEGRVAPVDLRAVPPVAVVGEEDRGPVRVGGRIGARALDLHRMVRPRVVVRDLDLPRVLRLALAVAEPVVHLELDPRAGQQVERRRRLELVARQELAADQARVRVEDRLGRLGFRVPERDVAAEPAALRPHQRIVEVVVRAVDRARVELALVRRRRRAVGLAAAGVVEVLLAQPVAQADQRQQADGHRQAVPPDPLVDLLGEAVEE